MRVVQLLNIKNELYVLTEEGTIWRGGVCQRFDENESKLLHEWAWYELPPIPKVSPAQEDIESHAGEDPGGGDAPQCMATP